MPDSLMGKNSQISYLSIGCIISGIAPSPTAVVIQDCAPGGTREANFLSKMLITKHILLIVKPGIATDANPCQMTASMNASVHDRKRKS